ncbi:MAG: hypothetical protein ABUL72_01565 [Armatimonadota bacterium]
MASKKTWKWLAGSTVLVVLATAVFVRLSYAGVGPSDDELIRMTKKAGIPQTTEELYPAYKGEPDKNAATYVDKLRDIDNSLKSSTGVEFKALGDDIDPEDFRVAFETYKPYFSLLEKASECQAWYPPDRHLRLNFIQAEGEGLSTASDSVPPDFIVYKLAVQRLSARARLRAKDKDFDGALADLNRMVKLADLVGQDPTIMGLVVDAAYLAVVQTTITKCIEFANKDAKVLAELQNVLESPKPFDYRHFVMADAATACLFASHPVTRFVVDADGQDGGRAKVYDSTRWYWAPKVVSAWVAIVKDLDAKPFDAVSAEKTFEKNMVPLVSSHDGRLNGAHVVAPQYDQLIVPIKTLQAKHDLLAVSLTALLTGAPPSVQGTVDPFGGAPYHLVTTSNGWKVYSVGSDAKDDGGKVGDAGHHDVVFAYDGVHAKLSSR